MMAGLGHWTQQITYRNCGNCPTCRKSKEDRPHGPYSQLRRRNPLAANRGGKQDHVYLGRVELTEAQINFVNERFNGPEVPTREEVFKALGV
ncbi:MAG: hypothetical protein JRI53_04500 [Deltaproteobacteria bacterium]|nr:hypothetical protein [Deltaproteobacteria bacterium]